jgi:hypothetical protein
MKKPLVEMQAVTPDGIFIARYSETGLAGLGFPKVGRADAGVSMVHVRTGRR